MKKSNRVIAIIFIVFLACTAISGKFYNSFSDMVKVYLDTSANGKTTQDLKALSTETMNALPYKNRMVGLSGSVFKIVGTRSYYNKLYGLNITTDGYSVKKYNYTSTDYEVEQITAFKKYLDTKGISLLYVSEPTKYIDDMYFYEQFGTESYVNRNTDLFLSRISKAGIAYLDLRDNIRKEKLDSMSLFYKTDHHWTVPAARWAASKVAEKLNQNSERTGYNIDLSLYSESNFNQVKYEKCWLGEQGRLVSTKYIGLDDYTMMEPRYATNYTVTADDNSIKAEGDFNIFINKSVYESKDNYATTPSWHYSYRAYNGMTIQNNNIEKGKVLVLGDSFEQPMVPIFSLGIHNIKLVVLRDIQGSIRDYIEKGNYDAVIIAYAPWMIGAHDDSTNANYRMFTLE